MPFASPTPSMPTPVLSYSPSPLRDEICVERGDDAVRVILPPVRDWRLLPAGYKIAAVALLGVIAMLVFGGLWAWGTGDSEALFINGGIYAVFLGILLTAAHQRISRSLIFEVSPAALTITHVSPGGRRSTRRLRPGAAHGGPINGGNANLAIHDAGRDAPVK